MAEQTTHYGLLKPGYDESADIEVINGNMDTIDTQIYNANTSVRSIATGGTGASTKNGAKEALDIDDLETAMGGVKFIKKTAGSSGGKVTYTFTNYCSFVILCSGANSNVRAQIHGNVTNSGSVSVSQYNFGSNPSVSTSTNTNKLVLTNSNTDGNCYTCMIVFYGTAPTVT